jgi:hypothetical protein
MLNHYLSQKIKQIRKNELNNFNYIYIYPQHVRVEMCNRYVTGFFFKKKNKYYFYISFIVQSVYICCTVNIIRKRRGQGLKKDGI